MSDPFWVCDLIVVNPNRGEPVPFPERGIGLPATGGAREGLEKWGGCAALGEETEDALGGLEIGALERPNRREPFLKVEGARQQVAAAVKAQSADAAPEPFAAVLHDVAALEGVRTIGLLSPVQERREAADEGGAKEPEHVIFTVKHILVASVGTGADSSALRVPSHSPEDLPVVDDGVVL